MKGRASSPSSRATWSRWDTVKLGHSGLSLLPRLRVLLSFSRADLSVRPLDEWQLRQSLLTFLRDTFGISVSDNDLSLHKHKDTRKCRSNDSLASAVLYIWDIQALMGGGGNCMDTPESILHQKEGLIIDKLTAMELNLGGIKLRCRARPEDRDDILSIERSWREAHETLGTDFPNTMAIRGIPARWLAELRVSSKASVLVTHTIFSQFGTVRNVDIQTNASDSLSCDVWVQFEHYSEFYNAMLAFCGRSMMKEDSNFRANYEVNCDNNGYFTEGNIRKRKFEKEQLEEQRRRQALMKARQADIERRQAELARLEQEKREAERIERLREEERRRKEREDVLAEQEMMRQKELERLREEERIRKEKAKREKMRREEEQKAIECQRRESELQKLEEQMKEKQRAMEIAERDAWAQKEFRAPPYETEDYSHLEWRSKSRQADDGRKVPWKKTEDDTGDYHHSQRSRPQGDHSSKAFASSTRHDDTFPHNAFERWELCGASSSLPERKDVFEEAAQPHNYKKRLRSVIVDSRHLI